VQDFIADGKAGVRVRLPAARRPRLLIADRRPIAARGLAAVFQELSDLDVATCHAILELSAVLASGRRIEAVAVDVELFDGDASRAVDAIRRQDGRVSVLLLTTRVDAPLLDALAYERVSCVSVYSEGPPIVTALCALLAGQTLLPPEVQRALVERLRQPPSPPSDQLTLREEQVLELAAAGLTISQIAARLHVSHSTAKTHLLRVYEKLDAPNRSAAVAIASARGMLRVGAATA
jgi:DNA-binding NarL/FixJ family response regulator